MVSDVHNKKDCPEGSVEPPKGKRAEFVKSLKPVMGRFFSKEDSMVLESFRDLNERPTKSMVRDRYILLTKQSAVDEMGLHRVHKKLAKAWNNYMTN